jgi:hypothetical protein
MAIYWQKHDDMMPPTLSAVLPYMVDKEEDAADPKAKYRYFPLAGGSEVCDDSGRSAGGLGGQETLRTSTWETGTSTSMTFPTRWARRSCTKEWTTAIW